MVSIEYALMTCSVDMIVYFSKKSSLLKHYLTVNKHPKSYKSNNSISSKLKKYSNFKTCFQN